MASWQLGTSRVITGWSWSPGPSRDGTGFTFPMVPSLQLHLLWGRGAKGRECDHGQIQGNFGEALPCSLLPTEWTSDFSRYQWRCSMIYLLPRSQLCCLLHPPPTQCLCHKKPLGTCDAHRVMCAFLHAHLSGFHLLFISFGGKKAAFSLQGTARMLLSSLGPPSFPPRIDGCSFHLPLFLVSFINAIHLPFSLDYKLYR